MAFFGLTQVGYQDAIREHVRDPPVTPQYVYRSGLYRDPTYSNTLPPISANASRRPSIVPKDQASGFGPGPQGSYREYTRLKYKHIRDPQDIIEIYRHPVTTAQEIARWRKDEPIREREPWTIVKRRVRVNSEMTKFVEEMSLTNRDFSLF